MHRPNSSHTAEPLISIVVPVFDESETVALFTEAMAPVLADVRRRLGRDARTEILFVDDGSRDDTVARIEALEGHGSEIRLVRLSRNFGKDAALSAGLEYAAGHAVVPMDVDLQDPPEVLLRMVDAWKDGAFVVNAVRADRSSDSWAKRNAAAGFYRIYNRLTPHPMPANVGDFRLLDRRVVDHLLDMPEKVRFMKGMFSWVGYAPVEIPYARPARTAGTTKWRGWSLWNFALDGITGSTTLPLRIWTYLGFMIAIGALGYAAFIVVRTLILGIDVPGYASIMVALLTFAGLNMIALGILGEYIGRIAIEVRARPLYLVRSAETTCAAEKEEAPDATPLPLRERIGA